MSVPTSGEAFAKLTEYLRKAQEEAAIIAHLERANDKHKKAQGWLAISELLKRIIHTVTQHATGKLN